MPDVISDLEFQVRSDPYDPVHQIALAKAYLEEGDEERARKVIAIKRRLPSKDPTVHFEWGKLCEELGMSQQARESYEQAIALNPGNSEYHFQIAILLYERGAWERAMKHLQKTLSLNSQNEMAKKMLTSLYEEIGFGGSAKVLQGVEKKRGYAPPTHPIELTKEEALLILDLFKGREVGYARYHFVDTGNLAHSYINGIMGFNEILKHVKGEETFGVYPLRSDRTLKFSVIRVRVPWRRIVGNIKDSGFLAISEDNAHQYAREIVERVKEAGLSVYLEKPGVHERRIWSFFEEFIPVELSERFLNSLIDRAKAPGVDIAVSLILGFRGSGLEWQDHPVMLPLGVNKRAGKRCFFIDEDGKEYENQLLFIEKIRVIPRSEIRSFLKSGGGQTRRDHKFSHDMLLRLEKLCPVVEEVVRKARSGRNLRNLRTVLMRLNRTREHVELDSQILTIRNLITKVDEVESLDSLRGYEGRGSAVYFEGFSKGFLTEDFQFPGRVRRPPTDPINALMSLEYMLLLNQVIAAVSLVGFDPFWGTLHSMDYGRPSLALDLMEEWRPTIVDTLVLGVLNLKALTPSDFEERSWEGEETAENEDTLPAHQSEEKKAAIVLTEDGFRKFISQYERKMSQKVQYHLTGEQLNYRDCIREQVRHFVRYLKGEEKEYQPMPLR